MSILKGILHHWNKTTQSYDTIHPETEVSQVTDWNQGIVNTLASTALGTLVNTLTSDSLLATMIQKVLTATGVKYSMGQNGYIHFGSLFGGLIIQWGYQQSETHNGEIIYPVGFTKFAIPLYCLKADESNDSDNRTQWGVTNVTLTGMTLWSWQYPRHGFFWIVIGI